MSTKMLCVLFVMIHLCLAQHSAFDVIEVDEKEEQRCKFKGVFMCNDIETPCINRTLVCNGISECPNGEDESPLECGCLANEFQCNNSHCVDMIHRCDLNNDCEGGTDEEGCETYECPSTHFKCNNHFCIPKDKMCNFIDDCLDNSDEINCNRRECYATEFRCNNSECVPAAYLCDKQKDCLDGSDEDVLSCRHHLRCDIGLYVSSKQKCDGWVDCYGSQKDEVDCEQCSRSQYRCNNNRCIGLANVCDGDCDCYTCEDEVNCGSIDCVRGTGFLCRRSVDTNNRCINNKFLCDGVNDCRDTARGSDEIYCSRNISDMCADFPRSDAHFECPDGQCIPAKGICDHIADCRNGEDERGCDFKPCPDGYFRCKNEKCVPNIKRCDGAYDCWDRSDEVGCEAFACKDGYRKCRGGMCIEANKWCDHRRDCPDQSDETNCQYRECLPEEFRCNNKQCISRDYVCDNSKEALQYGCTDKSHLLNCTTKKCKLGQFKCRNSYCISLSQKCDGNLDCHMTYWDEQGCAFTCPYKDNRCECVNESMDCSNRSLEVLPNIRDTALSKFDLSNNQLKITSDTFAALDRLTYLDLSKNSISHLPDGCFRNLWRLATLNLEDNNLTELSNATFYGLSGLRQLYISGNRIQIIFPDAFFGLSALRTLDLSQQQITSLPLDAFLGLRFASALNLSGNNIDLIEGGAFNGMDKLQVLDIRGNNISTIDKYVFRIQNLDTLYTDEYRFCCLAKGVSKCYPEPDEFSSCEDLMSNYILRVSIWILGMVASFGNLLVIGWRARDLRGGKVHSFLITNLAIGDFFMGVYLMIIAVVDSYYRGVYIIHDHFWRASALCRFAGFISTFSSELSVFTLTVITLDRLICIIFPLRLKRLGLKEATVVMILVWLIVFILSTLPLMGLDYFENFYGRSGVCLALHVTQKRPTGWEYSVAVFLVLNFVSFVAIFLSYLWMFIVAKRTRKAVRTTESKSDAAMARRMTLIVMTDFFCWVPIILLGFASLGGAMVPSQVYAWIAVFVLPLNSAINPVLYTISTAPFLGNVRKRAYRFRKSFMSSLTMDTKHSYVDERSTSVWDRKSPYRHMDLIRMRNMNNRSDVQSQSDQSDY
ncbi:G-protein coupled receptor GRL101-like [Haliotis rufescens]|uniref:G-protein coupled receptor GRL101-like n=1 Tax=Haliotis rufescens TaxID=6454 RepID=UPI00201F021E|nr:G-protein coupled receptor GRL101-like [Haliotis rufescens]